MKRIIVSTLLATSLLTVGCAKVVKTETIKAKAIVKELDYEKEYTTVIPICTGKTTSVVPQYHPAEYEVTIDYNGAEFEVDNEDAYLQVKDKLYKEVECEFNVTHYDDGKSITSLTKIEGVNVNE